MHEVVTHDPNQEPLIKAVEQARQATKNVVGAYSEPLEGRDHFAKSGTMQMPSSGGESKITVHETEDNETHSIRVRAETQTEPKGGSRSEYIATSHNTYYNQDHTDYSHGKVEVRRVDQNGDTYSHVYKSTPMAQKVGAIIANGITDRAREAQDQNQKLA